MDVQDFLPVFRSMAEVLAHERCGPALVDLPGQWVWPVMFLKEHHLGTTPEGSMTRAMENILVGVMKRRNDLISIGLTHPLMAAAKLFDKGEDTHEWATTAGLERAEPLSQSTIIASPSGDKVVKRLSMNAAPQK